MKGRGELEASETVATVLLALTVITMGGLRHFTFSGLPSLRQRSNRGVELNVVQ